jgi:hypothetical protein
MSLVKWFRKNNKKVMAVVVIVCMAGFVGGSYLSYLGRSGPSHRDTVAHYLEGKKITRSDLQLANRQLDILRDLRADGLLRAQDMQGILLAELIFAEQSGRGGAAPVINYIRQSIAQNRYRISSKEIAGMYERSVPSSAFWLLLKNEAHRAGVRVANADAGRLLGNIIPQLYDNRVTYSQLVGQLVRSGTSENEILTAFGDLMAILQYAHLRCSDENVTVRQINYMASRENETIDTEFVKFDSDVFAKAQPQPAEDKLIEQFNKYKSFPPLTVTAENPYGFGYKLPDRLRLEYIAVKLDDIASIIKPPTHEETEEYYQKNKAEFTKQVPSDPNDPNAPLVERTRSYAEVVDTIIKQMTDTKINTRAESILQQAKTLTDPNLIDTGLELDKLTSEQFRKMAGDYKAAGEQLGKEHNVKVYAGQTGLLNAADMQMDKYLGRLVIQGFGYYPVNLTQVAFAVDELGAAELSPFDASKPRMYENIGPAKDRYASARGRMPDTSEQVAVIVRVTEAAKAAEPNTVDVAFDTYSFVFDPNKDKGNAKGGQGSRVFSVREKVSEDLKKLSAMDTTRQRAGEFIELTSKEGWETAIKRFNQLYGEQAKDDPNDPNVFVMDYFTAAGRTTTLQLDTLTVQNQGNPSARFFLKQAELERQLMDELHSRVPSDSNTPDKLPVIVEFKPNMSFFCVKDLTIKRLWKEEFDRTRPVRFYRQDLTQLQSLAPIHFSPQNIIKRMKFRFVEESKKTGDANTPEQPEADV